MPSERTDCARSNRPRAVQKPLQILCLSSRPSLVWYALSSTSVWISATSPASCHTPSHLPESLFPGKSVFYPHLHGSPERTTPHPPTRFGNDLQALSGISVTSARSRLLPPKDTHARKCTRKYSSSRAGGFSSCFAAV